MHVNTRIDRIDEHGMQRIIIRDKELPSMQNYPGCACMYITLYVHYIVCTVYWYHMNDRHTCTCTRTCTSSPNLTYHMKMGSNASPCSDLPKMHEDMYMYIIIILYLI